MAKNDINTLEKLESYVDLLDKQMNGLLDTFTDGKEYGSSAYIPDPTKKRI